METLAEKYLRLKENSISFGKNYKQALKDCTKKLSKTPQDPALIVSSDDINP